MKKIFAILASARSGISLTTTGLLVLILPYISLAQIKIEERVEIDPQIIQPYYPSPQYTPCGPYPEQPTSYYQVIWNEAGFT